LVQMLAAIDGIVDLAMTTNGILLERLAEPLKAAGLHRLNVSLDTMDPQRYRDITRGGDVQRVLKGLTAAQTAGFDPIKINTVVGPDFDPADAAAVRVFAEANGFRMRTITKMDLDKGEFWAVSEGEGGVCEKCNRVRLTSNGMVKPCLFSDLEFSIRELGAEEALCRAVDAKPEKGEVSHDGSFYGIGG
jgi:GTP 3',8-cyclase